MNAKDFKDIQESFRRHSQELPKNIQSTKIDCFWEVPNSEFLEWEYLLSAEGPMAISFHFFLRIPYKDDITTISFLEVFKKKNKTIPFKDILQKIQKILDFQEKNIRKLHADFAYILIDNLIETQNFTPELKKILVESSEFTLCKNREIFTLKIEKKGAAHLLVLKDKKRLIERFYRNQFFKIHGKYYFVQENGPLTININMKIKNMEFIEDLTIQNTIQNFHALLQLIQERKDNPRKIQFPQP